MRHAAAAVVAFVIAVVIGVFVADSDGQEQAITTTTSAATTTTETPRAFFVSEDETVVGPAVIVAGSPYLDRNQLDVDFDVVTLAPTSDAADVTQQLGFGNTLVVPPEELNTMFLDSWVLVAGEDEIAGAAANPAARAARFDVGGDFDLATIDRIEIDSYAVFTPISADLELGVGNESARVSPGVTARLLAVTEQASTIVQIEILSERGFNLDNLRVSGIGPGWVSAVREAEGRPRWNLTFQEANAPSPISIRVEGSVWITVERSVMVNTEESP